jgi:hypothetical protein
MDRVYKEYMKSFKKWIENTDMGFSTVSNLGHGEVESDPFIPDQTHIQHALNISKKIRGFFPAFRQIVKTGAILNAFTLALKNGLPSGNKQPFNYSKDNWLDDEVQNYIAKTVGMDFNQVEIYCTPLKQHFVQIYNNLKGWDSIVNNNLKAGRA